METVTVVTRERLRTRHFALALEGAPTSDPSLAQLTRVAGALGAAGGGATAPSDEFRVALRQRLVAAAPQTRPVGGLPQAAPWRRRLVAASAVLAISTGGAAATAVASTGALPGDRLYEIKRAVENVQLALAPSDLAKGERYLAIASTRLDEVRGLLSDAGGNVADPILVETLRNTLSDMSGAIAAGTDRYFTAYQGTLDPAVLLPLEQFLQQRSVGLAEVRALLPEALLGAQGSMMVEIDRIARRVATAAGRAPIQTVAGVPTSLASLTSITGSSISAVDRAQSERDLSALRPSVAHAIAALGPTLDAIAAAAEKAVRDSAAAASAKQGEDAEVERNVKDFVGGVEMKSQNERSGGMTVDLPGHAGSSRVEVNVPESDAEMTTASSRLLRGLLGTSGLDSVVTGSLTDGLDGDISRLV